MSALEQWMDRRRTSPRAAARGPIGVYLTQEHLHLLQLEALGNGDIGLHSSESLTYQGTRTELLETPVAVRKLVRRGMNAGTFCGRRVVSAMPPEQVRVMSVSYPAKAAGSEASSIARLMADRVDGALSDYVIDFVPIRMSARDGERLALVAVSRLEHVTNYLDSLESAGLHVDFLEIGPLAIERLIEVGPQSQRRDHVIVINFGESETHLTTISGRRLLANQEVQIGEASVLSAIAQSLDLTTSVARDLVVTNGLDPARKDSEMVDSNLDTGVATMLVEIVKPEFLKLVREIDRAFLFADSERNGDGRRQILMVGSVAQWPGVATLLSSLASMPVDNLGRKHMPFAGHSASIDSISDQQAAEMSTAVGLALRGMTDDG